ncbi:hypothetical protein GCM10010182_00110 [Actinomadura cremea]|nr:hypothetical protein GCM10010182_00110 [Actinomadura cremea]
MTRIIHIDKEVRAWLEAQTRAGETHNDVLRRILNLDPGSDPGSDRNGDPDGNGATDAQAPPDRTGTVDPRTP